MSKFTPPKTYKAAMIKTVGGDLEIVDVPWKEPQHGQIVVKVLACGVCATDTAVKDQSFGSGLPRVPGHEIVGDIVSVPQSETHWKVGQRVGAGWEGGHCSRCDNCLKADYICCTSGNINGVVTDGGYAEYVTLRTESVAEVPKDMDPAEVAPLFCAGVTAYNSIRNMHDVHPGDLVAVQGIGGVGHLAIQVCKAMGYRTVALSHSSSKAKLARELGAVDFIDGSQQNQAEALQKMGGAKMIVSTISDASVIAPLLGGLQVGGTLLLLGVAEVLSLPVLPILLRRLSIRGWPAGTAKDSQETVTFAKATGVRTVVEKYPLSKAQEAWNAMEKGTAQFRAVICP